MSMRRSIKRVEVRGYVSRELRRRRFWKTARTIVGVVAVFYGIIFISSFLMSRG